MIAVKSKRLERMRCFMLRRARFFVTPFISIGVESVADAAQSDYVRRIRAERAAKQLDVRVERSVIAEEIISPNI